MIVEQIGTDTQVVTFGEWQAGRVVKVLFIAGLAYSLVDHDRATGSALRMVDLSNTDSVKRSVRAAKTKAFAEQHGRMYNWRNVELSFELDCDKIKSLTTWNLTVNQAVAEATAAVVKMYEAHAYHWRNS